MKTSGPSSDKIVVCGPNVYNERAWTKQLSKYTFFLYYEHRFSSHLTICFAFSSSGEVIKAGASHQNVVEDSEERDSIFLKNSSEEANELQNRGPIFPSAASDDKLSENPSDLCILPSRYSPESSHMADVVIQDEWISESADEEHIAKRMRTTRTDG